MSGTSIGAISVDHGDAGPAPPSPLTAGVWLVAAMFVAVEMAVSARYGFHRDELYFIDAGRHLAFGYVDQPPLAPLLTRVAITLFGASPTAVRVFPALAGSGVVVGAGLTARVLGGRSTAQMIAAVSGGAAPVTLAAAHLGGTTAYDLLAWTMVLLLVVTAVVRHRPRCWLGAGAVAGVGLENKDLLVMLLVALVVGLLATATRSVLRTPWPWLGLAIALVLWLPNIVWQFSNHLPALTMARALRAEHSAIGDYISVVPAQFLFVGLASIPLALLGLAALAGRTDLRFLVIAAGLILLYVVIDIPGRPYYTFGFAPLVFAAGAVRVEAGDLTRWKDHRWIITPVVVAVISLPFFLPVLPLSVAARLPVLHTIAYDLGETAGWPQLTTTVADVFHRLPTDQRAHASVFTANYGEAGALAFYGPARGLPTPLSGHNTFWLWGPGLASDATVVTVGAVTELRPHFDRCVYDATFRSPHNIANDENGVQIWTCSGPHGPWRSFWSHLRRYG